MVIQFNFKNYYFLFFFLGLLNVFNYSTVTSTITTFNGTNFSWLLGFGFYSSCNTLYYVMDNSGGKVLIFNDDWSYVSYKTFPSPAYMITTDSSLLMTGGSNIWKLDKDLNILLQHNASDSPGFRCIYYNYTNGFIYVVPHSLTGMIRVFDSKLIYSHTFSILSYKPFSISEYNNEMFVGTTDGTILVILNELIINQFNGCNGDSVTLNSILFDQYGYFATSCNNPTNKLYLYTSNRTYTGSSLSTPIAPRYIGFDIKERFVLISTNQILINN